jgi:hypothetical protein
LYSSPYSVAVAYFNQNTKLDIAVANYTANNVGIFLEDGYGKFALMISFPIDYGSHPFSIVVADFNNDRKSDFAIGNHGTDSLHLFLQTC